MSGPLHPGNALLTDVFCSALRAARQTRTLAVTLYAEERTMILTNSPMPRVFAALALAGMLGCASTLQGPSAAARAELAQTGKLRVAFVLPNALVVRKDPATGELRGMAIEVGREIAARLNVPFEPVGYPNVVTLNESIGSNSWDVVVRSIDPERAKVLDFTPAFMEIPSTFLVPAESPIRAISDVDKPGVRIVFPRESSVDLYFRRNPPKYATLERTLGPQPAIELLKTGKANVFAQNREILAVSAQQLPGSRILDGGFDTLHMSLGVPKGRSAASNYLSQVIEELKVSQFIREAIDRSGLKGAMVAPMAKQ